MDKPRLAAISTITKKVEHWVHLPGTGYGTAATSDGGRLLVAVPSENEVAVIDLSSFRVITNVRLPPSPLEVLVRPDSRIAYISCDRSGQVAALRLSDWSVKLIGVGRNPDGLAWVK